MMTDLRELEAAAGADWYRESRAIDAGSLESELIARWFAEHRAGDPLVFGELLDRELARYRGDE